MEHASRFVRFNLVGALGIGVQLTVLWLLVDAGRAPYLPATVAAVLAAIVHNFVWHLRWTWRDRSAPRTHVLRAFVRFAIANGSVSLAGNIAVMAMLAGGAGLPPMVANVIAIAVCGVVNYQLGDLFVFREARELRG